MNNGGGQSFNSSNRYKSKIKGGIYNDGDIQMENNYGSQTNTPSPPSSASAQPNNLMRHHQNGQNGYPQFNVHQQPPTQPPVQYNQGAHWQSPQQNGGHDNNNMNQGGYPQNAALPPPPPPPQQFNPVNAGPDKWSFYDKNGQQQQLNAQDKMYGVPISYGAQFAFNPYLSFLEHQQSQNAMQYDDQNEQKEGHNSFQELHNILNSKWWIEYNKEKEEKQKKLEAEMAAIKKELKEDEERLYNMQLAKAWGLPTSNNNENNKNKKNGYK